MNLTGLSLEQAPPIGAPFRFFLTAPLFGIFAGILFFLHGETILSGRLSNTTIAFTHLLTLGFISMIMLGALLQIIPVVAGRSVVMVKQLSVLVYLLFVLGTLSLVLGLYQQEPMLIEIAIGLLGACLSIYIVTLLITLFRVEHHNPTTIAITLALLSLIVTAAIGIVLGWDHAQNNFPIHHFDLSRLHLSWGLIGWGAVLIIGVAFQIIPMFHITPEYPLWLRNWLVKSLFLGLVLLSLLSSWFLLAMALLLIAFVLATWQIVRKRKRKIPEVILNYWYFATIMLLIVISLLGWIFLAGGGEQLKILLGVIMIVGFLMTVVTGMLQRIVPFLTWFHLQSVSESLPPTMKQLLPTANIKLQYYLHIATTLFLIAVVLFPGLTHYPAAVSLLLSQLVLGNNLVKVLLKGFVN